MCACAKSVELTYGGRRGKPTGRRRELFSFEIAAATTPIERKLKISEKELIGQCQKMDFNVQQSIEVNGIPYRETHRSIRYYSQKHRVAGGGGNGKTE